MLHFSPVPGRSFPQEIDKYLALLIKGNDLGSLTGQQFGSPYQGQRFGIPLPKDNGLAPYQGQQFGAPYQGQQFGQTYDNRWTPSFMSPNNSSPGILGNLPNHLNTLMGHASTIQNGYNMMRQLGSIMGLFR